MTENEKPAFQRLVDTLIRLSVLILMLWWCIKILSPFLVILIWGSVIAIAIHPLYMRITKLFRGKNVIASIFLTLAFLSIIIIPSWLIIDSLLDGIDYLKGVYESGQSIIPPPGEYTNEWPSFTKPFIALWSEASQNIAKVMTQHADQIKSVALWFFSAFSSFGQGLLQFVASIIIAGVLLVYSKSIHESSHKIFIKLAGEFGNDFASVTVTTIQSVVKGILGVAFIQGAMAGIGFFVAGVPFAGLWTILALMLAIVQVGAAPVAIPVMIYAFNALSPLAATLLTIWLVITLASDNILKPLLLGRNAPAPMLVIFLGAIGGFISIGFIGLFLGAVVLTLGYKLFDTWIDHAPGGEVSDKDNP